MSESKPHSELVEFIDACERAGDHYGFGSDEFFASGRVSLQNLVEQLQTAERRLNGPHEFTKAGPGDFVGHDGWECGEDCDACYFARQVAGLKEQLEAAQAENESLRRKLEMFVPGSNPAKERDDAV